MAFQYPWGNLQGLNLTWFINQFKKLREDWATAEAGIDGALDAEIQRAEDAMSDVFDARDAAAASATAAGNSASAAASSATLANNKATAAGLSEAAAAQSASQAALSASNAGNSATQAGNSATAAGNSATAAGNSATAAGNSATAAGNSATAAAISETNAAASAQRAEDAAASAQAGAVVNSVENMPIASVDDALDENVVELVVGIEPVQAGTGDPSPDNVRPISGWTGANIYRSGADTSDPTTYPITFPAEAGTVYGGTLTINEDGSGVLKVDRARTKLSALSWIYQAANTRFYTASLASVIKAPTAATIAPEKTLCECYAVVKFQNYSNKQIAIGTTGNIFLQDSSYTDTATLLGAVGDYYLVYELATPNTYQLTSQQVITLLAGTNNIWADTGGIDLLRYYADSKGYIDAQDALVKALIAKELDEMTADTALTANDLRIINNTLYRITAPIASGATLTPGTNCEATTVAAILKTLLT